MTLHFAAPNCMWYLLDTWLVTSSISCSFSRLWWIRHTASIHRNESRMMFACVTYPRFLCLSSLAISSISVAYSITDSTPPCLILSLICIFLISPCLVCILAVRLELRFLIIFRFIPFTPFSCRAKIIASSRALSYAFCTSRNIMYADSPLALISDMVCFKTIRWSTVQHPGLPPTWAFVIVTCFFTLSLMSLSYSFPTLLTSVIPLSFEHFPFSPLPL